MNQDPAPVARGRKTVLVLLATALAAVGTWFAIVSMNRDGGPGAGGTETPVPPLASTASPGPSATSESPALPVLPSAEAATVVWPDPGGTLRYGTPESAAAGFAKELAGFAEPVYGTFMQGDARSGELEVRSSEGGAVTTVMLRQLSDGTWYAIGATSSEIRLDAPAAGAVVGSPLELSGSSRAFEAAVGVEVRAHGRPVPLGTGLVMGGAGPDLEPFSGSLEWENPGSGGGTLLLFIASAADGSAWTAAAVPVSFAAQP
ncbi:Gmad2 immunoglobulin-like domain-containing protein [Paeniglutamicibacter sp. R2-26]|uniref:Gmad2 immunoglobulin-like domain-containing protein n=1 Tax=Paeniglutamicibacter sp. R2-26 TaxID=3144417 RepID=UPI003EE6587F